MQSPHNMLNYYFWCANIFFWLAVHFLFTQVQYNASLGSENELSWMRTWVLLSPWFVNWIWMTAAIFLVAKNNSDKRRTVSFRVLCHGMWMALLLVCYWVVATLARSVLEGDLSEFSERFGRVLTNSAQLDVFIYGFILALALGARFYHESMQEKLELRRLQHALSQEQLKSLRSQLNPHFLFNTLNTIASLVRLKRDKEAVNALSELSQMLRTILENKNNEDVRIKDEVAFINCYLSIQKMRFAEKLETHVTVAPDCLDIQIPNMLLHPLVENAVQHGSQLESNKNPLNLDIKRTHNELRVKMTNKVAVNDQHKGFGIGLTNTRARLSRLYGHFQLELNPVNDDLFETLLAIPIGEQDA